MPTATSTRKRRKELIAEIAAAFPPHDPPDRIAADFPDPESVAFFLGRCWNDDDLLSDVTALRRHADMLSYFTPKAFQYYLPAFLTAVLLHPRAADIIPASIVGVLTLDPDFPAGAERFHQNAAALSDLQKRTIAHYLDYLAHPTTRSRDAPPPARSTAIGATGSPDQPSSRRNHALLSC